MGMIACVEDDTKIHIVRWVGRVRLSVKIITYCNSEHDGGDGTIQLNEKVLLSESPVQSSMAPARPLVPCPACREAAK